MTPRATPMTAEDRRAALAEATLPLLLEHGRAVTTKQIADAAGVAEGTIFRVFESKDELVLAAVERGLDMEPFLADLATIDPSRDLTGVLLDICARLQIRFRGIFLLMSAMGMVGPGKAHRHGQQDRQLAEKAMVALVQPYAEELTVRPDELVHMLRLLTFSGTHPHMSEGRILTPEQIVGTLLHGVMKPKEGL
jgi:AcrR family transcriptional regulator